MAQQLSRYRRQARKEIESVLGALPPTAGLKEAKAALRSMSQDWNQASWIYKCFLRERKAALLRRFGKDPTPAPRVLCLPWSVVCDWCGGKGCLACAALRDDWQDMDWQGWKESLEGVLAEPVDADKLLVFADWLEERGMSAEAEFCREKAEGQP